jgi:putative MFS transporter
MSVTPAVSEQSIIARIERLPTSWWHVRTRLIVGVATFFDAFDSLTVAYVLPVIIPAFGMRPQQIAPLVAIGFAGQAVGAVLFGWTAERFGRLRIAIVTTAIFGVMSLVCATAASYDQLFWYRFVQGFGLGGEVPIAAAYINEIARAKDRGRFFFLYEAAFPVGLLVVALVGAWIVPRFGWQWLFVLGALPALLTFMLRLWCPESPRWLASKGRLAEADHIVTAIENEISKGNPGALPPVAAVTSGPTQEGSWTELIGARYLPRMIMASVLWVCAFFITYGLLVWLPTIFTTVYKLPVQQALNYSLLANIVGLISFVACAFVIDRLGRRLTFGLAFLIGSLPLFALWWLQGGTAENVMYLATLAILFVTICNGGLYLYTPELFPTRLRAMGASWSTFWLRAASIAGPYAVGAILPVYGLSGVFLACALVGTVGALVCFLFAVETKGKVLEEISP